MDIYEFIYSIYVHTSIMILIYILICITMVYLVFNNTLGMGLNNPCSYPTK